MQKKIRKKNITFLKISIKVLFPCLILLIFIIASLIIFHRSYMQNIKKECNYKLEAIYKENEINIQNVNSAIKFITANNHFAEFVKNTSTQASIEEAKYAQEILSSLKGSSKYIDSAVIVNKSQKKVYSPTSIIDFNTYFNDNYIYSDYDLNYWQSFKSPISGSVILPPTTVIRGNATKNIIPVIYTQINKIRTSNLIIVNIDISNILEISEMSKITPGSQLYMINKQNGKAFSADEFNNVLFDNSLLNQINDTAENSFVYKFSDVGKALVISYSPSVNHFGYSYCVVVPYSDIRSRTNSLLFAFIGLLILFVTATAFSIYMSTKKIYTPIDEIAHLFSTDDSSPDKFDFIRDSVVKVMDSNNILNEHYSNSLPLLHEKYLVDLLNSNENYSSYTYNKCPIKFKYDYFCSVVIKFRQTTEFYEKFDNNEAAQIKSGIYAVIQSAFNDKYDSYIMPCETDTLYVLLNLKDDEQRDSIIELIQTINDLFERDQSLIRIHVGLGMIRKGIEGMKKSHTEAVNSVSIVKSANTINLKNTSSQKSSYNFSIPSENALTNILLTGNTEKADDFISNLIAENQNIPESSLKELYSRIILVILRVMKSKRINTPVINMSDIEYVEEAMRNDIRSLQGIVSQLLSLIKDNAQKSSSKINPDKILEYINIHFADDINLEQLADVFETTPKYISKLIKDKHDINFATFLAGIRIEHSKELLSNSKKSLTDIYLHCGFNNRNTFVRTFKKITGMTPSEYRNMSKGN